MWVDGVQRVVCGLSEETSCQDVVIALAQAIGKHLAYVLQNLHGFIGLTSLQPPINKLFYYYYLHKGAQSVQEREINEAN